jgi:nucleotide-binding universal stress UspA family protein
MTNRADFPVLVATDGSRPAEAAVKAAVRFPWPRGVRGHGILARSRPPRPRWPHSVTRVIRQSELQAAFAARRVLRSRWPDAEVAVVDQSPVGAILAEARHLDAKVIVVGARGYGAFSRLVLGSVSRGVVRQAQTAVLVVKRPLGDVRRLLIGVDASTHARRSSWWPA